MTDFRSFLGYRRYIQSFGLIIEFITNVRSDNIFVALSRTITISASNLLLKYRK